ncbi:227 kDa spindle- and centromere-associated protein isoform X2 [Ooceraea biroi]|uniref:227 kDa spindle- and centromere-associated protein isoform X2 n=1 Tax=Ooceraea biroi TaxID=2015173 RepID=UPI0005BCF7A1|nr:227 kDa spindle- and centromere-associated protein isoform X2 [Ooceraea biroi]
MGQTSSNESNGVQRTSVSTKKYDVETSSEDIYFANDGRRQLHVGMNNYNGENQPRSEGPSPYMTLRTDELRNQRPMAPSLINVLPPKRETLATYTAQMRGWQSADNHGSSTTFQQNNNEMELSQIISQLAVANQQLASAHNATLTRMEALYLELSKAKENRKRTTSAEAAGTYDDVLWKRLQSTDEVIEKEESRRLEQRVSRLEKLLGGNIAEQCEQRNSYLQENSKLRSRIEGLDSLTRDTNDEDYSTRSAESRCQSSEQRTNRIMIDALSEVPDNCGKDQDATKEEENIYRYCSAHSDDSETNVPMINRSTCFRVDLDKVCRKWTRLRNNEHNSTTNSSASEKILKLSEEVEKLTEDKLKGQNANERLLRSLADQKALVEKLSVEHEEMKGRRYTVAENNLYECRRQHDELTKHLDVAKKEIERLLKEVDIFKSEKDTADTRISILEQDLQKSLLEKEQIKNVENQKASKLRAQLCEEVSDKKKQIKALEDALQEIQRLKQTIKTERKNDNVASDVDNTIAPLDDIPETTSDPDCTASNMEEFRKELALKREARHKAIAVVSSEMERLRKELAAEKEAHSETSSMLALLRSAQSNSQNVNFADQLSTFVKSTTKEQWNENDKMLKCVQAKRLTSTLKVSDEVRNDIRYQIEKVDDLRYQLETNSECHQRRIQCLTEVTNKARQSCVARERRTNELKDYLAQVLVRLGDKSFLEVQDDEGAECDRQLENINTLKSLYNGRLRVLTELKDSATKELMDIKQKLDYSLKKSENLEEELKKAEEKIDVQDSEITNLESQLGLTKADCRDLQNQMSLINGLFTQMLLGASSADMDLDRLTQLLQENHDLISDIAREESTEAAALPKLLLDLIKQVEDDKATQNHARDETSVESIDEVDRKEDDLQEEDIAHNLPKVWRVLLELLSCHAVTSPSVSVASCSDPNSCYKSVDTPAGPRLVISVSKTYIRLKELILEKKHLEKEMNRMKQLNTHLESKLSEQEKRLSMVSTELSKTWNIVGRMQVQHQQLHTHEEILRYELQQKRKMLQELKQELEYCREKWESARQKNTKTELEWRNLRREFAARKALAAHDSFNSAESGFSDERGDDTDEEEEPIEGRIRYGPRRRTRKENPRASTPDTESEQPTDTELSESKTGSSIILEQRTPTPETETELDETEVTHVDLAAINLTEDDIEQNTQEPLDPLDQALTNVIQNLIRIEDTESDEALSTLHEGTITFFEEPCDARTLEHDDNARDNNEILLKTNFCDKDPQSWTPTAELWDSSSTVKTPEQSITNIDPPSAEDTPSSVSQPVTIIADTIGTTAIFSIGPLPTLTSPSIKSVQFSNPLIVGPSNRFIAPMFGAAAAELENSTGNFDVSSSSLASSSLPSEKEEPTKDTEQRAFKLITKENVADSDSVSVDSFSSLDTVREFPTTDLSPVPSSTSTSKEELREGDEDLQKKTTVAPTKLRVPEEVLAARSDRLKRLEEQADWLVKKMNATSKRGIALCTRLEELHDTYGEPPVPPPMPDVLPSFKLPSSLLDLPCQVSNSSSTDGTETENLNASKDNASANAP